MDHKKPHLLVIMDGIGHRLDAADNAYLAAHTPHLDAIATQCAFGLVSGSGEDVGLPEGQFGNSEVGHMNLGAGRVLYQDSTRITREIRSGEFYSNPALCAAASKASAAGKVLHIFGLLSDGGVHSHIEQIIAMVRLALQQGATTHIHAFTDGRDTPPRSALKYIAQLEQALLELNATQGAQACIASVCGRYYAMDRDERWDRVQLAYNMLTSGQAEQQCASAAEAVNTWYAMDVNDEFIKPTWLEGGKPVQDGDAVVFMNFRADRARELSRAFVEETFTGFSRQLRPVLADFVMLTRFAKTIPASIAYMPAELTHTLGETMQTLGKTQLRIAETEKYAHVTFFFSGGREEPYVGEERILVKSPNVATYDLQPEMSALEVTDKLVEAIASGKYDLLVCNYANGDMVGHTGVFTAAVKAVETVDACIGRLRAAIEEAGGEMLITADHGNVEQMMDYASGQVHTQHTTEYVPFMYVGSNPKLKVRAGGVLADIAPTLLHLMGIAQPSQMSGVSLLAEG